MMYRVKEELHFLYQETKLFSHAVIGIDVNKPIEILGVETTGEYDLRVSYTRLGGGKQIGYIDRESLEEWK